MGLRKVVHCIFSQICCRYACPKVPTKFQRLGKLQTMKLNNDLFKQIITPEIKIVEDIFKKNGYELRIAGGAVRDLLMGILPHDIDFASTATPTQMKEMFESEGIRMINLGGEKHGTITVRINDKENYEITTLRIDTATDGRHAEVEFTTDWQSDANRRDLTVNAMFLSLNGKVYDYFKGCEHIEQRKVLFVSDPAVRIQEDYLRILRYFRFYGRIAVDENNHDSATLEAIRQHAHGLENVAGERLFTELKKIFDGKFHCGLICLMAELGVLQPLGFPQNIDLNEFKKVCKDTEGLQVKPVTKLSALLRNVDESEQLHARLRFSNAEKNTLLFIVRYREDLRKLNDDEKLSLAKELLFKRDAKGGSHLEVRQWIVEALKYVGAKDLIGKFEEWQEPKFPITGRDLIDYGLKKGPNVGFVKDRLREAFFDSDFTLTKDELFAKIPAIRKELSEERKRKSSPEKTPGEKRERREK